MISFYLANYFIKLLLNTNTLIMSTMNVESARVGKTKVTMLSGEMTFDNNKMMNELGGKFHFMFGNIEKVIGKIKDKGGDKLTYEQLTHLITKGTNMEFYDENKIWCYLCVRPSDFKNYMFSPVDSENQDNNFARIRGGVGFFYDEGFDIYIVPSS